MKTPAPRRVSQAITRKAIALLGGAIALCAVLAPDAGAAPRKPSRPQLATAADFEALTGTRAGACSAPLERGLAALGAPALRHCGWSQHLEMLYWQQLPEPPGACLPLPAIAWHRLGAGAHAVLPPWGAAWTGQSMLVQHEGVHQAGSVWRRPDGQWSAVLWRWRPSDRLPTRHWQAGHWGKVVQAVRAVDAGNPAQPRPPLMTAWLDATSGKPRMLGADSWRWNSGGACLDLRTAKLGQALAHLPFSRDDARLEQRSAMQVQLARRYPAAQWLRPFTLIEPAISGDRTGAKFIAVWKEGAALHGQLWIPLRDDGGIVRARISSDAAGGAGEALRQRTDLVERELTALAHAWEARHE